MHDVLTNFLSRTGHGEQSTPEKEYLAYGEGYTGSQRLRSAMARHLNEYLKPATAINAEELTFAAGVTALNEACSFLICDPGEAILIGRPSYRSFYRDLTTRTR